MTAGGVLYRHRSIPRLHSGSAAAAVRHYHLPLPLQHVPPRSRHGDDRGGIPAGQGVAKIIGYGAPGVGEEPGEAAEDGVLPLLGEL